MNTENDNYDAKQAVQNEELLKLIRDKIKSFI
jgi:hypothetical protein